MICGCTVKCRLGELTTCMIAKAQHDTPVPTGEPLQGELTHNVRVHLPLKGLIAYMYLWHGDMVTDITSLKCIISLMMVGTCEACLPA